METTSASSQALTDELSPHGASDNDMMDFKEEKTIGDENDGQSLRQLLLQGHKERTETLVQTEEIKQVKEEYRQMHGEDLADEHLVEQEKVEKVCCVPVKTGVRWWNVLAIPLVPCTIMLLTTYVNA